VKLCYVPLLLQNKEQAMSSDTAKTDCKEPHTQKVQRPNGPQHIRNYCIQKTNTFRYDFNAQALRRRQKRLAASQPAPPAMFQQVITTAVIKQMLIH